MSMFDLFRRMSIYPDIYCNTRGRKDLNERPCYKNTARNKRDAQKKRNKRRK